jgi:hypothetical protein
MKTIRNLIRKIEALDPDRICEDAVDDTKYQLLAENKSQLYAGKLRTGADLAPSYLDDPYFHTRAAAQAYSDWKDRITPPTTNRKKGIPNLFINGYYYASLRIRVTDSAIIFSSNWLEEPEIENKYGNEIYGLGDDFKEKYVERYLRPDFKKLMESATGLKLEFHGLRF